MRDQKLKFYLPRRPLLLLLISFFTLGNGCQFYPTGEYLRFVRIPENLRVGESIMSIEVHNAKNLTLESIEKGEDAKYFSLKKVQPHHVEILLAKSLETIVDNESPQNILKFRLICFPEEPETTPSFLSLTAYVEDVNDHAPQFLNAPYQVTVEELTPIGLTVFNGISAVDLDKPNTANSDVHFAIIGGNEDGKFGLESSHRAALIVKKNLDYDSGDHEFRLKIMASDRGNPPMSATTTLIVNVVDNDNLPPIFTKAVYRTQIKEFFPLMNESIRQEILFPTPIKAFDQDLAINASVEYSIVSGNEVKYFEINPANGTLYLIQEVDREKLTVNAFDLQIQARQIDNPTKFGLAKVEIEIIDLNDNLPQFEVDVYNISIMENLPNGFSVVQVYAKDIDQGENAEFVYKLEDRTRAFTIDPKTGWLTVRDQSQLDREKVESIKLKVFAEEKLTNVAFGGMRSHAVVEIYLLDANDNNPTFIPSNLYKFQVTIDSEIGSVVGQVTAEDPDLGGNGQVTYEFQKSNLTGGPREDLPFEIDSKNGYIYLLERPLPKLQYTLLVEAGDQPGNPSERRYSLAVVQVDVVKAGSSHSPEFIGSPYEFWVGTQVGVGTSVGQVKVKDLDPKHTVYDLLHSYYEGVPFAIEERTGIIAVVDELVKYSRSNYEFEAHVTDSRHTLTTNLTIHIVDPVDAVTDTTHEPLELKVKENSSGAVVANLRALLKDKKPTRDTRAMEFLLANYDARDKFAISAEGTIYTLKPLDREEKSRHLLTVISQSRGVIQGQGVYQIYVNVEDENDNPPKFELGNYEAHVRENSNPGTPVSVDQPIKIFDPDEGKNAEFKITLKGEGSEKFRVDPTNGRLYVGNAPLDREEKQVYTFKLVATDHGNLTSSVPITVFIDDLNDNAPQFFQNIVLDPPDLDQSSGPRELLRSASAQPVSVEIHSSEPIKIPETIGIGTRIARVMATDRDMGDNSKIFYRIVSENSNPIGGKFSFLTDKQYLFSRNKEKHFMIERVTGELSVAKPVKPDTEYALNISASDRGGLRTYTGIRVIVQDVNNHAPIFEKPWYTFEVLESNYLRGEIGKVVATDGDSGINGQISFTLRPKPNSLDTRDNFPFIIDAKSGLIFVEGDVDRERNRRFSFQAVATDEGTPHMSSTAEVEVNIIDANDNAPQFYNFMSVIKKDNSGKLTPVYRTSLKENTPVGSFVTQVFANDSDYAGNGNGLVLFHLNNHHKEFYIDSKNGTISTLTTFDYDFQNEFNLTVVASDLGRPSLSSTAYVLIRLLDTKVDGNVVKERMFSNEVLTFQPDNDFGLPHLLTKLNTTEKYKRYEMEFDLFGEEQVTDKFRIDPITGRLFVTKPLDEGRTYEFIVRAQNPRQTRGFDTRQGISDRYLEHNEVLVRVRMSPKIKQIPLKPSTFIPIQKIEAKTTAETPSEKSLVPSPTPGIITKANLTPRIISAASFPNNRGGPPFSVIENSSPGFKSDPGKKSPQKTSSIYAGEIAVLTLSCVIFLGGLVAAISIACVRRKRKTRRNSHFSAIPVEVRLQKQMPHPRSTMARGPTRPVIFPMALPGHDRMLTDTSDNTSDTLDDSPQSVPKVTSYSLQKAGFSICPDCRKLRKPGQRKSQRAKGRREISLPSSNDSGIAGEGSDGQCNCCSHNSSSESGREQYEDSLMPQMNERNRRSRPILPPIPPPMNQNRLGVSQGRPENFRRPDRVIIL